MLEGTEEGKDMSSGLSLLCPYFFVHAHNFCITYILFPFRSKKPVTHTDSWLERHFGSSSSSLRQQSALTLIQNLSNINDNIINKSSRTSLSYARIHYSSRSNYCRLCLSEGSV